MTDSIKTYPLFSELHKMTITERNQQLFDLRKQLDQKTYGRWHGLKHKSWQLMHNTDRFEQMFGEKNTLCDTP